MGSTRILKSIVPPLLWSIGSRLRRRWMRSTTLLEYAPGGWATPLPSHAGSDHCRDAFIARELAACSALVARVQAGEPMLRADDETSKYALYGYVLALAARRQQKISVLDYGGSLGDYYWLGRALVPGVELDYHCKELPKVAEAGRLISPDVTWHTDDACLADAYDLVMFSSSLQCLPDWQDVLYKAGQSARRYLYLSDVAMVRDVPAYVATHRMNGLTHLQLQMSRAEIVRTVERAGLRLVREFPMGAHPPIVNAPEQPTCVGWLFERGRP